MRKIISLFKRDYEGNRQVYDEVVPGAEWVQLGEGVATRKYDGTCCLIEGGKLFKRYTLKQGRTAPEGFRPATEADPKTGKQEGWVPVREDLPDDKYHREAFKRQGLLRVYNTKAYFDKRFIRDGTYELVGPAVQGNPEQFEFHVLIAHDEAELLPDAPRSFNEIKAYLENRNIEGIVWHHPDGRMVKIKGKDFGIKRRVKEPDVPCKFYDIK